jgi:hypothetical protein
MHDIHTERSSLAEHADHTKRTSLDTLLDLLADEVARRLEGRSQPERAEPDPSHTVPPAPATPFPPGPPPAPAPEPAPVPAAELVPEVAPTISSPASSRAAALMTRLALGVLLVVALINVPLNGQGTALARSIPSSASLVIRNGLVVKEAASPEIWVYRDGAFHWITSLDAFDHFGYRWQDVHVVEPGFLSQFDKGTPLYVLLKCDSSPHIYRLEAGGKRWIVDIQTFQAEGYVWKDVESVPCTYLRGLPDGDSIPPGRGLPPPPLP